MTINIIFPSLYFNNSDIIHSYGNFFFFIIYSIYISSKFYNSDRIDVCLTWSILTGWSGVSQPRTHSLPDTPDITATFSVVRQQHSWRPPSAWPSDHLNSHFLNIYFLYHHSVFLLRQVYLAPGPSVVSGLALN